MEDRRFGFSLKEVVIIIIATALVTSIATGVIVYNQNKLTKNLTYKDLNDDEDLKNFLSAYASLIDEYYENVDKKAMLNSAINAMFNYLGEDYSDYLSKDETDSLASKLVGEYKGIGVTLDGEKRIISFIDSSPAHEAGMEIGDIITFINGEDVSTKSSTDLSLIISKIDVGKKISIKVKRGEEEKSFEVENKKLIMPAINYSVNDGVGYLKIETFSNTLGKQVKDALSKMESQNMNSLVIDLRDNTGGYLSAATDVANLFLEKGKVIYSLEGKDETKIYKDETDEKRNYKVVLLFNDNSASASEILIAALQESYGAKSVGIKSYGKGKVQQTHSLDDGSMLKYTSAKWLTPNGKCIDGIGITPDIVVEDSENDVDEQLLKAIEVAKE